MKFKVSEKILSPPTKWRNLNEFHWSRKKEIIFNWPYIRKVFLSFWLNLFVFSFVIERHILIYDRKFEKMNFKRNTLRLEWKWIDKLANVLRNIKIDFFVVAEKDWVQLLNEFLQSPKFWGKTFITLSSKAKFDLKGCCEIHTFPQFASWKFLFTWEMILLNQNFHPND